MTVCVATWYGLAFPLSPATRKPSELLLKARSTNRGIHSWVCSGRGCVWSLELKGTPGGLDHPLPGNVHDVTYCFCISYDDAVATRQRSDRSFAALRASYQLPSLLGMLLPLAYLSPHFPSQTRRCLLRPMTVNTILPPLYSGEIQPATIFSVLSGNDNLVSRSKPQEHLGWLVGWLPKGRGDEAGTRVGGPLSV